jgi:hypothetical protein
MSDRKALRTELLDGMLATVITCNNGLCWKRHGTKAHTVANCAGTERKDKGFVTALVATDVKTLGRMK